MVWGVPLWTTYGWSMVLMSWLSNINVVFVGTIIYGEPIMVYGIYDNQVLMSCATGVDHDLDLTSEDAGRAPGPNGLHHS